MYFSPFRLFGHYCGIKEIPYYLYVSGGIELVLAVNYIAHWHIYCQVEYSNGAFLIHNFIGFWLNIWGSYEVFGKNFKNSDNITIY